MTEPRSVIELDKLQSVPESGIRVYHVLRDGMRTMVVQVDSTPLVDDNGKRTFRALELLQVADGTAGHELLQAFADVITKGDTLAAQLRAEQLWVEYRDHVATHPPIEVDFPESSKYSTLFTARRKFEVKRRRL